MCKDYLGIDVRVGDTVVFPTGKDMMDGVVEKIRARHRLFEDTELTCQEVEHIWKIYNSFPEYRV